METEIVRYSHGRESTLGLFLIEGKFECYTLEDEKREVKVPGETRIPEGRYQITLRTWGGFHDRYKDRFSDIHRGMLWIRDVPNFKYILFHPGNDDDDTEGCPLWGDKVNNNQIGDGYLFPPTVETYKRVYPKLAETLVSGEEVWITVQELNSRGA